MKIFLLITISSISYPHTLLYCTTEVYTPPLYWPVDIGTEDFFVYKNIKHILSPFFLVSQRLAPLHPPPTPQHFTPFTDQSVVSTVDFFRPLGRSPRWLRTRGTCWRWWPGQQWRAGRPLGRKIPQTFPPRQSVASATEKRENTQCERDRKRGISF